MKIVYSARKIGFHSLPAHRFVEIAFHSRVKESLDPCCWPQIGSAMYESICPPRHVAVAVALDEEVNGFLLYCYNHRPVAFSNKLQISPRRTSLCIRPAFLFRRRLSIDQATRFLMQHFIVLCTFFVFTWPFTLHMQQSAARRRPEIPTGIETTTAMTSAKAGSSFNMCNSCVHSSRK